MPLLSASDLKTHYNTRDGLLRSVDGVDLVVERGETVGLVGESGCGKSTLGKTLLRLVDPTAGRIEFKGEDITTLDQGRLRNVRKSIQMIFQDPFASLNPRHTIGEILEAPLVVHKAGGRPERRRTVAGIIAKVGLPADAINRYPHEFSGGQRQRIGIARALLLNPELIVCDEPVSALDLSIQAQILNLLVEMKKEFGLSYLFISHDLSVVRYFCDRVLVMYLGRIVESADNETLWSDPRHPYTRALMAAVPDPSRPRQAAPLGGDLPSPSDIPSGCRFHTRCPLATDLCRVTEPEFRTIKPGHQVACHVADHIN
ncbi:oligopeptide/dipeptide ABC transporter ATP-binding protein [Ensifer sp. Root278]|uniref:ABC transporter ATP-binding protein n=1 Tax=Ensifer sp. Root278 TaxID=1736509 RepID=UPI0007091749|nr:oligopeptide/dipeptide ABC transporter ATP-binding protein [Ensifer sp. Root278]KRD72140.1 peptide ABC transporter ATP-binding protein [Ensifer sp. Root278]